MIKFSDKVPRENEKSVESGNFRGDRTVHPQRANHVPFAVSFKRADSRIG